MVCVKRRAFDYDRALFLPLSLSYTPVADTIYNRNDFIFSFVNLFLNKIVINNCERSLQYGNENDG